jgi:fumarate reductase flavoprotein subunit
MTKYDFDVVVVGGGLAGLAAACRSAEFGLRVAILEAGAEQRYLCNSRIAMGFFNVAFRNISEDPKILRRAIDAVTLGHADPALADTLATQVGPALAWLRRQGVRLIVGNWRPGSAAMLAPPAAIGAGLRWPGRGPDQMLRRLEALLLSHGGKLFRGTRARELMISDGRCTGVIADSAQIGITYSAAAVVIADGGYQGDPELVRQFITPRPERVLTRNAGTGRGDGLRMVLAAGGRMTDSKQFYGHVQSADALTNPGLWPYPTADHLINAGMAVDASGRRIFDEGLGGVFAANAIARQSDPLGTFAIFDSNIWATRGREFPLPANPLLAAGKATIFGGATLEDLAQRAKLPPDGVVSTVERYNAAVLSGRTRELEPPRSAHLYQPMPIRVPPFYAVPLVAGITYTMGGIAIDGSSRVQHRDGGVIEGLYAAGSATGGHEGGPAAGYTGGLSKALTFGWHAANQIAAATGRHASHRNAGREQDIGYDAAVRFSESA